MYWITQTTKPGPVFRKAFAAMIEEIFIVINKYKFHLLNCVVKLHLWTTSWVINHWLFIIYYDLWQLNIFPPPPQYAFD